MTGKKQGVEIIEIGNGTLEVRVGGALFTRYHYSEELAFPFFHPVIGPGGCRVTRDWPVEKETPGDTNDHLHHKSIWVSHGDVNGVDNWSELEGHGYQKHREFTELKSGVSEGCFTAVNDWTDANGVKVLEEERTIVVLDTPATARVMRIAVVFRATECDVKFGDTKEGGMICVRVATSMDGDKGGTITNARGGMKESECWGKQAEWCDYSGPVNGTTVGIAILDDPSNFRHPTYWHVRDYGLMTANPFGLSHFYDDPSRDGSHVLQKGDEMSFSYEIYIHSGDASEAKVKERYEQYVSSSLS